MTRRILIVTNPHRPESKVAGQTAARALADDGIEPTFEYRSGDSIESVMVLGGDGTMLHAAHLTRGSGAPLLGVNLGRVGFLAELERDDVTHACMRLSQGDYAIEERGTLELTVIHANNTREHGWALNEVTVERSNPRRTLEVAIEVDGTPLSSFGCDGVIVATATGSTAHAFSAGGPVMWPNVDALLFVPLAAHALFARPLVIGPSSFYAIEIAERSDAVAQVVLDGDRAVDVDRGGRIEVRRGEHRVTLARMDDAPFASRLVDKFSLPTAGWRGEREPASGASITATERQG
ncbi:MAG: NAD kinase [Demequina sp.]